MPVSGSTTSSSLVGLVSSSPWQRKKTFKAWAARQVSWAGRPLEANDEEEGSSRKMGNIESESEYDVGNRSESSGKLNNR